MAATQNSGYFGVSKKHGAFKYVGPSGKHFNKAQVAMFYANGGKFPGQSAKEARAGWRAAAHQRGVHHATQGKHL